MLKLIAILVAMATSTIGGKTDAQEYFETNLKQEVLETRREYRDDEVYENIEVSYDVKIRWIDEDSALVEYSIGLDDNIDITIDLTADIDEDGELLESSLVCYIINNEVYVDEDLADEAASNLADEYGYDEAVMG